MAVLTEKQVISKYKGRYIDVYRSFDYSTRKYDYEVRKSFKDIHENTCIVDSLGFYDRWGC